MVRSIRVRHLGEVGTSAYCLAELKYGTDRNRPILPFVIDDHTSYSIPLEVTPMRNQWFEYDGDPARMLQQIIVASGKIQWSRYSNMPAPRPLEPNTGSGSVVKEFQRAVRLAEDGHFDEAIKCFRNVTSLDYEEWGEECQQWVTRLQLYALIAELADDKWTLARARKKWDEYLRVYDIDFDPLEVVGKLALKSAVPKSVVSLSQSDEQKTKIFVSHSNRDTEFARQLAQALNGAGISVWLDVADIPQGMKWSTAIQQGLNECEAMIVIISPDSMASVNVEDEWQYYLDKKKKVFPVRWKPADVHFQLSRIQYIDFHEKEFAGAFDRLSAELKRNGIAVSAAQGQMHEIKSDSATPPPTPPRIQGGAQPLVRVEDILPPPFEWVEIPGGKVRT